MTMPDFLKKQMNMQCLIDGIKNTEFYRVLLNLPKDKQIKLLKDITYMRNTGQLDMLINMPKQEKIYFLKHLN